MSRLVVLVLAMGILRAQAQEQAILSLDVLVGKQVIVQRIPLCQPGTFTAVLTYAGKQATVTSLKPSKAVPILPPRTMNRLPAESRAIMEDQQRAATLVVQFEDGT